MSKTSQMANKVPTLDPLSLESQCELAKKAQDGDDEAKIALFGSLKGLIGKKMIMGHDIPKDSWDDVMAICYIGFERALAKFNPEFGVKFSTYAFYWLRVEFNLWFKKQSFIRLPNGRSLLATKLEAYLATIPGNDDWSHRVRNESVESFCEQEKCSQSVVRAIIHSRRLHSSDSDKYARHSHLIKSPSSHGTSVVEHEALALIRNEAVEHAMKEVLTDRDQRVFQLFFGLGEERKHTQEEIVLIVQNITTRQAIGSIISKGLRKLKEFLLSNNPELCPIT
jgi:RNA polymerase nonessential primary-like sigma factor